MNLFPEFSDSHTEACRFVKAANRSVSYGKDAGDFGSSGIETTNSDAARSIRLHMASKILERLHKKWKMAFATRKRRLNFVLRKEM